MTFPSNPITRARLGLPPVDESDNWAYNERGEVERKTRVVGPDGRVEWRDQGTVPSGDTEQKHASLLVKDPAHVVAIRKARGALRKAGNNDDADALTRILRAVHVDDSEDQDQGDDGDDDQEPAARQKQAEQLKPDAIGARRRQPDSYDVQVLRRLRDTGYPHARA